MPTDLQRPLRRALVARLRADEALLALVPLANIQPHGEPEWPFIRLHSPLTQRLRASGVNGGTIRLTIFARARDRMSGNQVVEYAEDHCSRIAGAIKDVLADNNISLGPGMKARIERSDEQGPTAEQTTGSYFWAAQLNCRVMA
jgi:hypothetical protein